MKKIQAVIPAAGNPSNLINGHSGLPDTMLPINGKPVIGHLIEDLIKRGILNVFVILSKSDIHTEKYIKLMYSGKLSLTCLYTSKKNRNIVDSLNKSAEVLDENKETLIYLGDTIYTGKLSFSKNFLVVDKSVINKEKWCTLERNGTERDKFLFFNKIQGDQLGRPVLCGLYFFKNTSLLKNILKSMSNSQVNISNILEYYQETENFNLVHANGWYDCGNIENYHQAKIDFLRARNFNTIIYDNIRGTIKKTSTKGNKIIDELNWFRKLPNELKIFTPRLISFSANKNSPSYELEFYGYQSLADMFTFGNESVQFWEIILKRTFVILDSFHSYKKIIPISHYRAIYLDKMTERLDVLRKDKYWKDILERKTITINGLTYKNIYPLFKNLPKIIAKLHEKQSDMTIIHGDLCLSNILCDANNLIFKYIDPRGSFGVIGIWGDRKYDLAKLRHSLHGNYDFIVSDLFYLKEESEYNFTYKQYIDNKHSEVARIFDRLLEEKGYAVEQIALIEGLLFLSMIPLHNENPQRQKAMYLTSLQILQPYI